MDLTALAFTLSDNLKSFPSGSAQLGCKFWSRFRSLMGRNPVGTQNKTQSFGQALGSKFRRNSFRPEARNLPGTKTLTKTLILFQSFPLFFGVTSDVTSPSYSGIRMTGAKPKFLSFGRNRNASLHKMTKTSQQVKIRLISTTYKHSYMTDWQ
jgi:hypothetical protein